jgi:hypothetical protein
MRKLDLVLESVLVLVSVLELISVSVLVLDSIGFGFVIEYSIYLLPLLYFSLLRICPSEASEALVHWGDVLEQDQQGCLDARGYVLRSDSAFYYYHFMFISRLCHELFSSFVY